MNNKLLTLEQVADYLGVHRDTVYKLVRSGRLSALQLGGRKAGWRVSEEDLQKFIAKGKSAPFESLSQDEVAKLLAFDESQVKALEDFQLSQWEKRQAYIQERREAD